MKDIKLILLEHLNDIYVLESVEYLNLDQVLLSGLLDAPLV